METAKTKVFGKIKKRGKGYVFSAMDFIPAFKRFEVDQSLRSLCEEGKIDRVMTGIYYYPDYNEVLQRKLAPDIRSIADTIARKNSWKIFPEGNTALNYLGLSTQVPAQYVYISTGPSHKYKIGKLTLEFRHRVIKESDIKDKNTNLVIQSIKSMGKIYASEKEFIEKLSRCFGITDWNKIYLKSKKVTYWIFDIIKQAKELADERN